jgi:hypothetical protein
MRKMKFPKVEKSVVKMRLREEGKVVTTRTSLEYGKWRVGDVVEYAGFVLRVVDVKSFGDLGEHPFLDELDEKMKRVIGKYGKYDVVWLEVKE